MSASLRELIAGDSLVLAPGVYDALSAKVADQQGFACLYMSGFSVAGTLLGEPDIGLVSMNEMIERARQIVGATSLPVIADGDNGYGGAHNVARLVRAYEQAGVQCIQLEDQVSPKRCGHMENKEVVPLAVAVEKIRAAVASRHSPNFLVMARTDAIATDGLDEALHRAEAFREAGADILFVEAPGTVEEMQLIREKLAGTPLVANMVEGGKTPQLSLDELDELGYSLILRPVSALLSMTAALRSAYESLAARGELAGEQPRLGFDEFNELVGLPEYINQRYE